MTNYPCAILISALFKVLGAACNHYELEQPQYLLNLA